MFKDKQLLNQFTKTKMNNNNFTYIKYTTAQPNNCGHTCYLYSYVTEILIMKFTTV